MTLGEIALLRQFLNIRDLLTSAEGVDPENQSGPEVLFDEMARIAAWAYLQKKEQTPDHDDLLAPLMRSTSVWMGLLLHLASIDYHFFFLAKRMAARTLLRPEPTAMLYRKMAAILLTSYPPDRRKPKLASHVSMVIGIAIAQRVGWSPTETSHKDKPRINSGCGRMATAMASMGAGLDYGAVDKVWKSRQNILMAAGFDAAEVLDFLRLASPMKNSGIGGK